MKTQVTSMLCRDTTFVVVDLEGNGAVPAELVELAIVTIENLRATKEQVWRVRPASPITRFATKVHGLTNKEVSRCPELGQVADDIQRSLNSFALVAHNAHVEYTILSRSLPNWTPLGVIDTLRLTKLVHPKLKSYALASLREALPLNVGGRSHDALEDARATATLFLHLYSQVGGELPTLQDLLDFLAKGRIERRLF
jgi:exodeoxyribonuclease X